MRRNGKGYLLSSWQWERKETLTLPHTLKHKHAHKQVYTYVHLEKGMYFMQFTFLTFHIQKKGILAKNKNKAKPFQINFNHIIITFQAPQRGVLQIITCQ